jgi:hypothetical protein
MYLALPRSRGRFTQDILIPGYSGNKTGVSQFSDTELSSSVAGRSRAVLLTAKFVTPENIDCRKRGAASESRDSVSHPFNPLLRLLKRGFGLFPVRSPLLRESLRFLFLWLLRCFTSPGQHPLARIYRVHLYGLPHSDIPGSQPAQRLPEAYRSHAASFIAIWCQGILRTPLSSATSSRSLYGTACTVIYALITRKL